MPKDHQSTYGQISLQVTDTWEELLNKFGAYHNADVISGRYSTIEKSYKNSLAAMTKRPSSLVHNSASRSRHVYIQRQVHYSYKNNNVIINYNCSDHSYKDSRSDNRSSYQPNDFSSRTTGNHRSRSNHQYGE